MKQKISSLSRATGIILGIALTLIMAFFSVVSVITNGDFWLKQNDRYKHQETLSLVSSDDYSVLYHGYVSMLEGKESNFTVTKKGNPDDFSDTFKVLKEVLPETNGTIHFEGNVINDGKFIETLNILENTKYSKVDLNNKTYVEISCPQVEKTFSGLKIDNLKITDKNGENVEFTVKQISFSQGSQKVTEVENIGDFIFQPKSNSTLLRAYIKSGDIENISVAFDASMIQESTSVKVVFSYEDSLTSDGVASIIGVEEDILTDGEKAQMLNAGRINNILKIVCVALFVFAVALFVFTVKKEKRQSLLGIGFYIIVTALIVAAIINLLVYIVPSVWGFDLVFDFNENTTTSIVMGQGFKEDFAKGTVRFFDFIMLGPLLLGYVFTKIARTKHYDPNEDYLYQ